MIEAQNDNSVETEVGNSTKPLLQAVFLAPYLPHGLKLQYLNKNFKLIGVIKENLYFEELVFPIDNLECKPILKPISDLSLLVTEEFEKYDGKRNGKANEEIINLFCEENGVDEIIENIELKSLPYECIEFMFRNHYDFFGLIEKGLAISAHDVEQHCL